MEIYWGAVSILDCLFYDTPDKKRPAFARIMFISLQSIISSSKYATDKKADFTTKTNGTFFWDYLSDTNVDNASEHLSKRYWFSSYLIIPFPLHTFNNNGVNHVYQIVS